MEKIAIRCPDKKTFNEIKKYHKHSYGIRGIPNTYKQACLDCLGEHNCNFGEVGRSACFGCLGCSLCIEINNLYQNERHYVNNNYLILTLEEWIEKRGVERGERKIFHRKEYDK